jgi:hypothetical protein
MLSSIELLFFLERKHHRDERVPMQAVLKLPQQYHHNLEFPGGSQYYPGPMLLNFSAQMGTGVSNNAIFKLWGGHKLQL